MPFLKPSSKRLIARTLPHAFIWLIAGLVFMISDSLAIGSNKVSEGTITLNPRVMLFASLLIFLVGFVVGLLETTLVNKLFSKLVLWKSILYKIIFYACFFTAIMFIAYPFAASLELQKPITDQAVWSKFWKFWGDNAFLATVLQLTFSLLLSLFYSAVSENLGHKVLKNFFTGAYHKPIQEERIFMFVDMKASTTIAEQLGHVNYFNLLQAYYNTFSKAIINNNGEVYQYIGDEIVITWKALNFDVTNCIHCFFDMKKALLKKQNYFNKTFGIVPDFKAGLHLGQVTAGELGALKKEIVYTGDVLNVTARIQGLCNKNQTDFLLSEAIVNRIRNSQTYHLEEVGGVLLKGKQTQTKIFKVSLKL